jgi:hypothetical protein
MLALTENHPIGHGWMVFGDKTAYERTILYRENSRQRARKEIHRRAFKDFYARYCDLENSAWED